MVVSACSPTSLALSPKPQEEPIDVSSDVWASYEAMSPIKALAYDAKADRGYMVGNMPNAEEAARQVRFSCSFFNAHCVMIDINGQKQQQDVSRHR